MKRFLSSLVFAFSLISILPNFGWAERPNVLMIVVDDMNDWVGCLGGHPDIKTPNIDRLAARGMLFTRAYCDSPLCNPSRTATMTGRRTSSTEIYSNKPIWHQVIPKVTSLPQYFLNHGYHVAGGGKLYHHMPGFNRKSDWHLYFDQVFDGTYQSLVARGQEKSFRWPKGFPINGLKEVLELRKPPANPHEFDWGPWDSQDLDMGDGKLVQWATEYLRQPPQEPFFLAAGIFRPHLPWYAPKSYFDAYPPEAITLPAVRSDDLEDVPSAGKRLAEARRGDHDLVHRAGKYREILQAYMANLSYADALVGRLLDALDASPAAQKTIVVFWSDHGWHLGEKQHMHKSTLWERATHVPLILTGPSIARESKCSRPVGLVDLFPTLNELCTLPRLPELEGTSLVPLLRNPEHPWNRPALSTFQKGNHAVRSDRYRYIRYADGSEELYDHEEDRHEWNNLANDPKFSALKTELGRWIP